MFAVVTFMIMLVVQSTMYVVRLLPEFVDLVVFFSVLVLMASVVAVANAAIIINQWNLSGRGQDTDNRDTVTVVILSAIFYSLNGMYLVWVGVLVFCFATGRFEAIDHFPIFLQIVCSLAVPLKSAVNPVVRLIRDPDVSQFVEHVRSIGGRREVPRMQYTVLEEAE